MIAKDKEALVREYFHDPVLMMTNCFVRLYEGAIVSSEGVQMDQWSGLEHQHEPEFGDKCVVPWVHRGIVAVILKKTKFLSKYGELDKIQRNFRYQVKANEEDAEGVWHYIFKWDDHKQNLVFEDNLPTHVQLLLPRGGAKTTVLKMCVAFMWLYQLVDFGMYLSDAQAHAEAQLGDIKMLISDSPRVESLFGVIKPKQRQGIPWREDLAKSTTGVMFGVKGMDGKKRGLNRDGKRPRFIGLDDIENKDHISTEAQRKKLKSTFWAEIKPALPRMQSNVGKFKPFMVVLGTLLADNSLMGDFQRGELFATIRFGVFDIDGNPWWPKYMNQETYDREKQEYIDNGELRTFYLEYDNRDVPDNEAKFNKSMYRYLGVEDEWVNGPKISAIALDPAISPKRKADLAAMAVVSYYPMVQKSVIEWVWGQKGPHPDDLMDAYVAAAARFGVSYAGVETNGLGAVFGALLPERLIQNDVYVELTALYHSDKKLARVEGTLRPLLMRGTLIMAHSMPTFTTALTDWPNGYKDVPDVVAMAVGLLGQSRTASSSPGGTARNADVMKQLQKHLQRA